MITITAISFWSGSLTESQALQAAADHAASLDAPVIFDFRHAPGDDGWDLDETVHLHLDHAQVYPGVVHAHGPLDVAIIIDSRVSNWTGRLRVHGDGSALYRTRSVRTLVELGDVWGSRFDGFVLTAARRDCLAGGTRLQAIATQLGSIMAHDCGSPALVTPAGPHVSTVSMTYDAVDSYRGWWAPDQYSRLSGVRTTHPTEIGGAHPDLEVWDAVYIEDRAYLVTQIGPDYLDVYPHYRGSAAGGTIVSAHGAAVRLRGGSTTGASGDLACIRSGVCLHQGGLYGGEWSVIAEASGIGMQIGAVPHERHLRGIYSAHFELPPTRLAGLTVSRAPMAGTLIAGLLRSPLDSTQWDAAGGLRWDSWAGATFVWDGEVIDGASITYRK